MAGEEQVESVGAARDVFIAECALDVAGVARITALSDLTHDLVTGKPAEVEVEKDKRKLDKFLDLKTGPLEIVARWTCQCVSVDL